MGVVHALFVQPGFGVLTHLLEKVPVQGAHRDATQLGQGRGRPLRRRRSQRNYTTINFGIIFTTRPPNQSPPPIVITDVDPAQNDDGEILDEP